MSTFRNLAGLATLIADMSLQGEEPHVKHFRKGLIAGLVALIAATSIATPAHAGPGAPGAGANGTAVTATPPPIAPGTKATMGRPGAAEADKAPPPSTPFSGSEKASAATKAKKADGGATTFATSCSGNPGGVCYEYAGGQDLAVSNATGANVKLTVHNTTLRSWDDHAVSELAVQSSLSGPSRNIAEALIYKDASGGPIFDVYHWVGGVGQGYGAGFTLASPRPITPGDSLAGLVGGYVQFWWQYFGGGSGATPGWWLAYGANGATAQWVGLFEDTRWTSQGQTFTDAQFTTMQAFGELTCSQQPCQSHIGNGQLATTTQGARAFGYDTTGTSASAPVFTNWSLGELWTAAFVSNTEIRYGGPGGFDKIASTTSPSADDTPGVGTGTNPSGQGAFATYNSIASAPIPSGKVTQIDGSAGPTCRGNVGTSAGYPGIRMVAMSLPWKVTVYPNGTCTGAGLTLNHGRIVLPTSPTNYQNLANFSYKVLGSASPATCAAGPPVWPGSAPTC